MGGRGEENKQRWEDAKRRGARAVLLKRNPEEGAALIRAGIGETAEERTGGGEGSVEV